MKNKYYNDQKWIDASLVSKSTCIIALLMMLLSFAGSTVAAAPGNNLIPIPNPITIAMRSKAVTTHLKLTTQQQLTIDAILTKVELPLFQLRDTAPEVRAQSAAPLINQLKTELQQTLSAKQFLRLKQILWQAKGLTAIIEPEVAEQLRLTTKQTQEITTLLTNLNTAMAEARKKPPYESEAQNKMYLRSLHSHAENNILAMLTDMQIRTYSNLYGPIFNISMIPPIACKAPSIRSQTWINTAPQGPSTLTGKVTVVHFYAFNCINCKNNLPFYNAWQDKFPAQYFQVIGIHTPEIQEERILKNVKKEAKDKQMIYPIAVDQNKAIWNAWANQMWPSIYLIDKNGFVRYWWYGELNYKGAESEKWMRSKIIELLNELNIPRLKK